MDSLSPLKRQNYGMGRGASSESSWLSNGGGGGGGGGGEERRRLTKVLFNVHIQNSLGPVQVMMLPENTVVELMKAAIDVHVKEKRRPLMGSSDPVCFELHYSQFSLQSLKPEEKLRLGLPQFLFIPTDCDEVN